MIVNYLAKKKRSIYLVMYENGMYGVEKITKACGCGLYYSEDKDAAVNFFNAI